MQGGKAKNIIKNMAWNWNEILKGKNKKFKSLKKKTNIDFISITILNLYNQLHCKHLEKLVDHNLNSNFQPVCD
jgi:hypothetical protein